MRVATLFEAPRKPKSVPKPELKVDPDAAALAAKAKAQAVYEKALKVAKFVAVSVDGNWDQSWAKALAAGLKAAQVEHDKNEKEEAEYTEGYEPRPFMVAAVLGDVMIQLWQEKFEHAYDLSGDVRYEMIEYLKAHPQTESSDALSLLQSQREFAHRIEQIGLVDLESMDRALTQINDLREDETRYWDHDHTQPFISAVTNFICHAIPLILQYARYAGAQKAA